MKYPENPLDKLYIDATATLGDLMKNKIISDGHKYPTVICAGQLRLQTVNGINSLSIVISGVRNNFPQILRNFIETHIRELYKSTNNPIVREGIETTEVRIWSSWLKNESSSDDLVTNHELRPEKKILEVFNKNNPQSNLTDQEKDILSFFLRDMPKNISSSHSYEQSNYKYYFFSNINGIVEHVSEMKSHKVGTFMIHLENLLIKLIKPKMMLFGPLFDNPK